jgi:hypothetical protein
MVNLDSRLAEIKKMVDVGKYFVINRGRQYGKTTILNALENYLKQNYIVISLDFQLQMSNSKFQDECSFSVAFADAFLEILEFSDNGTLFNQAKEILVQISDLVDLFRKLSCICRLAEKKIVVIIDEVDSASNNQVFLDFLAQLRGYYLKRNKFPTFQSVILAGVHDIRNLRQKIRPDTEHKHNSPWNIASSFDVDMSFSVQDISGMLTDYENDYHTGMDIHAISQLIYDYTSGYPVLVSSICKHLDEEMKSWTKRDVSDAVKMLLKENSPLFESLINKIEDNAELYDYLYQILIEGRRISYNPDDSVIKLAMMYGFVKEQEGSVVIANRIFETRLYNAILTAKKMQETSIYRAGEFDKNQFIENGRLNMERILEKFIQHFNDIYGNQPDKFKEDDGRKLFLLYLRPIINGTGNYYIEAQTRDMKRTDVIVDYLGKQYIIELKIWHGDEYNTRGENQLAEYLDYYHIEKGYLLSFNFNKNKQSGMHTIELDSRTIVEAVV